MTTKDVTIYEGIIDNYVNGNHTDAREQVAKLSKSQLLELIVAWNDAGMSYPHVVGILQNFLDN